MVRKCGQKTSSRFFSATGEFITRVPLAKDEDYDLNRVYEMLPKISKQKSKTACKIHCYTSEIKLKRSTLCKSQPPRKAYSYKDIHQYYSFASNPDIIVFACSTPTANTKTYDFLRLDERRAQELPLLIDRARIHPLYLLLDEDHNEQRLQSSQVSPSAEHSVEVNGLVITEPQVEVNCMQGRNMSEHSGLDSHSDAVHEELIEQIKSERSFFSDHGEEIHSSGSRNSLSDKPCDKMDGKAHPLHHDPLFKDMCANIGKGEIYDLDMIYVNPEAKEAKRDMSVGNVYLFVARYAKDDKELEDYYQTSGKADCRFVEGSPKIVCY